MRSEWNHNNHYHELILSMVPHPCVRGLDVGCGGGLLTRRLASHCIQMTGIDLDHQVIAAATGAEAAQPNVSFVEGDVMTYPFPLASFTFISAVATLHHLPLEPALTRFRELLAPGGVLMIVGLYRPDGIGDAFFAALGFAASWTMKRVLGFREVAAPEQVPMQAPRQTLREIRETARRVLPPSTLQRRLLFRYSLIWCKPQVMIADRSSRSPGAMIR